MRRRPSRVALSVLLTALALIAAAIAHAEVAQKGNPRTTVVTQKGNLRTTVAGKMTPRSLPRTGTAPIAISVSGQISTVDNGVPPQLKELEIEINRHGRIDYAGLPTCSIDQIQPASSDAALRACRTALVGQGKYLGTIALPGLPPTPIEGRLLVFNGKEHGRQILFGQIYSAEPFTTSFVIRFEISSKRHGQFGTTLTANLARALGSKRTLTGIEMTLSRRYSYHGKTHSYLSAGCPAAKGFPGAVFPLARTSFSFAGGPKLSSTLTLDCKVRG